MKNKTLFIGFVIAITALALLFIFVIKEQAPNANDLTQIPKSSVVDLIEYGDFQCPACGAYHPLIKRLLSEYGDKIKLTYRHFPLTQHKNAVPAAKAYESSRIQSKEKEMLNMLYENQTEWSTTGDPAAIFDIYATNLKLDVEKFKKDVNLREIDKKIKDEYQSGVDLGINATPTFLVNGHKIPSPTSYENFKSIIDYALQPQ